MKGVNRVNQLQRNLIIHSVIYYDLSENIILDATWDNWAKELLTLDQKGSVHEEDFKTFDGSTGYHLSRIPGYFGRAQYILNLHKDKKKLAKLKKKYYN